MTPTYNHNYPILPRNPLEDEADEWDYLREARQPPPDFEQCLCCSDYLNETSEPTPSHEPAPAPDFSQDDHVSINCTPTNYDYPF